MQNELPIAPSKKSRPSDLVRDRKKDNNVNSYNYDYIPFRFVRNAARILTDNVSLR